jgi:hypothetical protein
VLVVGPWHLIEQVGLVVADELDGKFVSGGAVNEHRDEHDL